MIEFLRKNLGSLFVVLPLLVGMLVSGAAQVREGRDDQVAGGLLSAAIGGALLVVWARLLRTQWRWAYWGVHVSTEGLHVPGPGGLGRLNWAHLKGAVEGSSGTAFDLRKGGKLKIPSYVPNARFLSRLIQDQLPS